MDLTTLASVKASPWLAEAAVDWQEGWDAIISYLITARSADAEQFCNRWFEKIQRVQYCDGGGPKLFLQCTPISSLVSVKWSLFYDWTLNFLAVPVNSTAGAAFSPITGEVILCGGINWYQGDRTLQVTYIGGYDPPPDDPSNPPDDYVPIPADLEQAICQQVAYDFLRKRDLGIKSVSFPDGSIQKNDVGNFLPKVQEALGHYRFWFVG